MYAVLAHGERAIAGQMLRSATGKVVTGTLTGLTVHKHQGIHCLNDKRWGLDALKVVVC